MEQLTRSQKLVDRFRTHIDDYLPNLDEINRMYKNGDPYLRIKKRVIIMGQQPKYTNNDTTVVDGIIVDVSIIHVDDYRYKLSVVALLPNMALRVIGYSEEDFLQRCDGYFIRAQVRGNIKAIVAQRSTAPSEYEF